MMVMMMMIRMIMNRRKLNNFSIICVMFLKVWMANYKFALSGDF